MDFRRYQQINGRLTRAPIPGLWAPGAGSTRDPAIPWLPLGDLTPGAIATPKPEIALRSSNSLAFANRTNSTFTAPSGIVDGDIIIILHEIGNLVASFASVPVPTPPAGFSHYDPGAVGPLNISDGATYSGGIYLFWKRASGESGNYTVTHALADSSGFIGSYTGMLETGTPFGAQSADNTGTDTLGIGLSLNTTASRSRILFHEICFGSGPALTPPDGMVERLDASIYVADQRIATIATSATRRHTNGGTRWGTRMVELLAAVGSGTTTAAGAASGTGVATGVGRSTARSPGAAAGTGTAAAVGRSAARAVGAASGTGTATGVGRALAPGVGAASGTGTAAATGRSTARSVGAASGTGTAAATGASTARSVGAASGTGTATGVASAGAVGAAAGTGTASGVGASTARSVGAASGTGTATGVILTFARSVGAASGTGTATGVASGGAVGSASGTGTATGVIISFARAAGAASGAGTANGVGNSTTAGADERPRAANDRITRRRRSASLAELAELQREAAALVAQVVEAAPDDEPPPAVVARARRVISPPAEISDAAHVRQLDAIIDRLREALAYYRAIEEAEQDDEETALMLLVA